MEQLYFSTREVATIFGRSLDTVRNLEKQGVIKSIRLNNGHRIFSCLELEKIDPNFREVFINKKGSGKGVPKT